MICSLHTMSGLAVYIATSPPRVLTNSANTKIVKIRMFEGNRNENIEKYSQRIDKSRESVCADEEHVCYTIPSYVISRICASFSGKPRLCDMCTYLKKSETKTQLLYAGQICHQRMHCMGGNLIYYGLEMKWLVLII